MNASFLEFRLLYVFGEYELIRFLAREVNMNNCIHYQTSESTLAGNIWGFDNEGT